MFCTAKTYEKCDVEALQYKHIFGNIEAQSKMTQVYQAIIILRERLHQGKLQNVAYSGSNSRPGG